MEQLTQFTQAAQPYVAKFQEQCAFVMQSVKTHGRTVVKQDGPTFGLAAVPASLLFWLASEASDNGLSPFTAMALPSSIFALQVTMKCYQAEKHSLAALQGVKEKKSQ